MKNLLAVLFALLASNAYSQKPVLIDTHNDVISNQLMSGANLSVRQHTGNFDLVRAREGGMNGQVFSVWCGGDYGEGKAFKYANREIDSLQAMVRRNPQAIAFVRNTRELRHVIKDGKLAAMIGVEGGHMIEDRIDYLDSLARRGMVYLTLTWNNSTKWATSAHDEYLKKDSLQHKGLTDFGKQVVRRMNELGVMVDVSHVGPQTFYDAIATSSKPVIASHSCAYALNPNPRNLNDEQLKVLAAKGGVVFVNFYSGFLDSGYANRLSDFISRHQAEMDSLMAKFHNKDESIVALFDRFPGEANEVHAPLSLLIKHIDYIAKLVGVKHVGIGADYEGAESYPAGMGDVSAYPKIATELRKLGYSKKEIALIAGGNFIRIWRANRPR